VKLIKKGSPYLFSVNLEDGKEDKFIRAFLMDINGVLLSTYNIPHVSNGVYLKSDILALNEGIFLVKYEVYKDAGFTKLAKQYSFLLQTVRVEAFEENINENIDIGDGRIA